MHEGKHFAEKLKKQHDSQLRFLKFVFVRLNRHYHVGKRNSAPSLNLLNKNRILFRFSMDQVRHFPLISAMDKRQVFIRDVDKLNSEYLPDRCGSENRYEFLPLRRLHSYVKKRSNSPNTIKRSLLHLASAFKDSTSMFNCAYAHTLIASRILHDPNFRIPHSS
ncbi:unnamed protein product [Lathyrus oleraceus]